MEKKKIYRDKISKNISDYLTKIALRSMSTITNALAERLILSLGIKKKKQLKEKIHTVYVFRINFYRLKAK